MSSENITTVTKIIESLPESLPESLQQQVVEHLREYIETLQDEMEWNNLVNKSQNKLIEAARKAKQEIAAGKSIPMDYDQL